MSQISKAIDIAMQQGGYADSGLQNNDIRNRQQSDISKIKRVQTDETTLKKNKVLTAIEDESIIDTYRLLRTRIQTRMRQNNWKTIGITSAGKNDGKTLTAVNLGISIAMKQNVTVVVVDADLRNPSIHEVLGLKPQVGIGDYLTSNISIDDVLVNPGIDRLAIIPGNNRTQASSELLSSLKMGHLVKELKTRFPTRIVIFDLPPVLVGDDVVAFAPNLDAALLVVEEGNTESDKLKKSVELLENVEIIGTILNKSKDKSNSEEYYY